MSNVLELVNIRKSFGTELVLNDLSLTVPEHTATVLIGASGSFETFYELIHNEQFPEKNKSIEISVDHLTEILEQIISSTQEERNRNQWIIPIRKKMAPIAAVKTRWVLRQIPVAKVFISPYSLKEGVIFE
mgnify:CR=1 FL=1